MTYSLDKINEVGTKIFKEKVLPHLSPVDNGKFVVIDPDSGDYLVDRDETQAIITMRQKHPGQLLYIKKIGEEESPTTSAKVSRMYASCHWHNRKQQTLVKN